MSDSEVKENIINLGLIFNIRAFEKRKRKCY